MERIFMCLLCLSGWSVSSCLTLQYHYVDEPMTWTEAQTYCRQKYTDLATVENTEEMDQLMSSVPSQHRSGYVWIGLYSHIKWKWSDGYKGTGSDYRRWQDGEPSSYSGLINCVFTDPSGIWLDDLCQPNHPFICFNGTQQNPDFVLVTDKMNWPSAQRYCRENYVDLATVKNQTENQKIQTLVLGGTRTWIGLHSEEEVFWSDGSGYSFQFLQKGSNLFWSMSVICGAAFLQDSGRWRLVSCEEKHPFVCYSTGSKHVIKLKMRPDDPSLDLNDPELKAGLLKELQDQLKKSGLSGVTLKWREQPDGKVFHQEEESSQGEDEEKCELFS